jgi:hypothetical protein
VFGQRDQVGDFRSVCRQEHLPILMILLEELGVRVVARIGRHGHQAGPLGKASAILESGGA